MAMNNSLAEVHPELVSEWSEKNIPLTPDDITFGSNKKVWWKGACGHEWQTSVKDRSNGEKCPICSGARVIAGINDLATLEPLLVKQWSKKNKIKPTEVSIGSHKKVIWRCEKGHEWEAAVKSRTINKTGCPYCSHNKVLAGFNDLATLLPDIAAEWSDRNYPLLPTQVTVFANRKAWWKCKDCGREWNTLISTRSGGSKCPYYITESSEQIGIYIKALIDISRTIAGYQLHLEKFDIADYMGQIKAQASSLCLTKGICLQLETGANLGTLKADKLLLERAIMNVISNALDHSPPQGTIYVTVQKTDCFLHISITDEGGGFTPEALHHAQEQFFMGDKSRTSNMHFGMGLYITSRIIKQHGGQLVLSNSKKTGGAQVTIKIPY